MEESRDEFGAHLAAAKGGDREALGWLFDRARPDLLAAARRALPADLRAKTSEADVVQDALLEAQLLVGRFEGETAEQFRAWVRAIVANKLADTERRYRRTQKRASGREQPLGEGDDAAVADPGPGSQAASREQESAVTAAVAKLPQEYQDVIRLRTWEQLSFAEVGRVMGRTEDAARMLWVRAVERLRAELGA